MNNPINVCYKTIRHDGIKYQNTPTSQRPLSYCVEAKDSHGNRVRFSSKGDDKLTISNFSEARMANGNIYFNHSFIW